LHYPNHISSSFLQCNRNFVLPTSVYTDFIFSSETITQLYKSDHTHIRHFRHLFVQLHSLRLLQTQTRGCSRAYQFTDQFLWRLSERLHLLHDIKHALKPLPFHIVRVSRVFGFKFVHDAEHQLMLALVASVLLSRDLISMTL